MLLLLKNKRSEVPLSLGSKKCRAFLLTSKCRTLYAVASRVTDFTRYATFTNEILKFTASTFVKVYVNCGNDF